MYYAFSDSVAHFYTFTNPLFTHSLRILRLSLGRPSRASSRPAITPFLRLFLGRPAAVTFICVGRPSTCPPSGQNPLRLFYAFLRIFYAFITHFSGFAGACRRPALSAGCCGWRHRLAAKTSCKDFWTPHGKPRQRNSGDSWWPRLAAKASCKD